MFRHFFTLGSNTPLFPVASPLHNIAPQGLNLRGIQVLSTILLTVTFLGCGKMPTYQGNSNKAVANCTGPITSNTILLPPDSFTVDGHTIHVKQGSNPSTVVVSVGAVINFSIGNSSNPLICLNPWGTTSTLLTGPDTVLNPTKNNGVCFDETFVMRGTYQLTFTTPATSCQPSTTTNMTFAVQ